MKSKKPKSSDWGRFQDNNEEAITITKHGSLFNVRAWKKDGKSFVPALETIYTSSQDVTPAHLGKVIQKVMSDAEEKKAWVNK